MRRYLRGFRKVFEGFFKMSRKDYLGRLPRHYATDYEHIDRDSRRAMARLGIRSPDNLRGVLKRNKVDDVDELIRQLRHHRPVSKFWRRVRAWVAHGMGLYTSRPQASVYREIGLIIERKDNKAFSERAAELSRLYEDE